MTKRRLSLFFGLLLVLGWAKTVNAQSSPQSSIAIALSEYCVSNIGLTGSPQSDFNGNRGDWVEIYSNFSGAVNLNGYYLSNDKNDPMKWPFPSNFIIAPNQYRTIWLSGKNTHYGNEYHTNFTIDQCKGQWLILSNSQGTVRDSVFILRTKEGHSRARVDFGILGNGGWRIFTTPTFGVANTGANYIAYAPKPIIVYDQAPIPTYTGTSAGGFYSSASSGGQQTAHIFLENGVPFDTTNTCFRIYYTTGFTNSGIYPSPGNTNTTYLLDSTAIPLTQFANMIRAISIPYSSGNPQAPSGCEQQYLPSFCETNTFFTDPAYVIDPAAPTTSGFSHDFGVVSIAIDAADTNWFNSSGANKPIVHVEYYDKQQQVCEGYTQINRPVQEAWLTTQKGFYMTIDDRRGFGCNFEGNIFNVDSLGASSRTVFPTLHLKAGDYESHSTPIGSAPGTGSKGTAIMDVFYQSVAAKNNLHVNPLHIKPVVAFINGKYQGVYDLREVYDKYYENYYNQQPLDSLDLLYYHGTDGAITYFDGPPSVYSTGADLFANSVYTLATSATVGNLVNYNKLFSRLDKESFMDYMILNSYAMNGNLWNYNYDIAYAKGADPSKPGYKWHYYLWNTPAIFNFTALTLPGDQVYANTDVSPCFVHTNNYNVTPMAGNGHGQMLKNLMVSGPPLPTNGRYLFQTEYKNRYQDLLNGPLKCENLLNQYDYVKRLFLKEMKYAEDPATTPVVGAFQTQADEWDTNTVIYRRGIEKRCKTMADGLGSRFPGCYGLRGPYAITVDVQPAGAGKVKLNTLLLENYIWSGSYYATTLTFKATPANDTYVFHHWEFKNHTPLNSAPISLDSLQIAFNQPDDVVAVFTDKKKDIEMPTGFTPNGDGINDVFRPLGSALFSSEFDMSVWNRWGQEVYRTTDPTQGWDGNFKGQQAQTGVYAFVISYKNIFNESKLLKGNLTLLR